MKLFQKMKDILFEEEEVVEKPKQKIKIEERIEEKKDLVVEKEVPTDNKSKTDIYNSVSEKDIFKNENTFPFPEFDEDEFVSSVAPVKTRTNNEVKPQVSRPTNIMEYERKKKVEKRIDYGRYERIETVEIKEKKKFRPSPIISPVYGVLNEDYKAEDIKIRDDSTSKIDIDSVRKKAFEEPEVLDRPLNTPTSILYEEVETVKTSVDELDKTMKVKTIDELLDDTVDVKIKVENDFDLSEDIPRVRHSSPIDLTDLEDEPLEFRRSTKSDLDFTSEVDLNRKVKNTDIFEDIDDDTLGNDLLDLFDSMYENKEEGDF